MATAPAPAPALRVRDLIKTLQSFKDLDAIVVVASDAEGNAFHVLEGIEPNLGARVTRYGVEVEERSLNVIPAVLLWPRH